MTTDFTIEQACRVVLGNKMAESIIKSQGLHWAIVAAVAGARTDDDPRALAAIRKHLDEQRAVRVVVREE